MLCCLLLRNINDNNHFLFFGQFNEIEGINNQTGMRLDISCAQLFISTAFYIIAVLTLVSRSVIITGQFNIGVNDNLSNCKHMEST